MIALVLCTFHYSCLVFQDDLQNPSQVFPINEEAESAFKKRQSPERAKKDLLDNIRKTYEDFSRKVQIISANLNALKSLLGEIRDPATEMLRDTDNDFPFHTISEITNKADQALEKAEHVKSAVQDAYTAQNNAKQAIVDAQLIQNQSFDTAQEKLERIMQDCRDFKDCSDFMQNATEHADDEIQSLAVIQVALDAMEVVARSQEILRQFKIIEKYTQNLYKDSDSSLTLKALLNQVSPSINKFITDMHPVFTAGQTASKKDSILKNIQLIENNVVKYLQYAKNVAEKLAIEAEAVNDKTVLNKRDKELVKTAKNDFGYTEQLWKDSIQKLTNSKLNLDNIT